MSLGNHIIPAYEKFIAFPDFFDVGDFLSVELYTKVSYLVSDKGHVFCVIHLTTRVFLFPDFIDVDGVPSDG